MSGSGSEGRRFTLVVLSHRSGRTASLTCPEGLAGVAVGLAALALAALLASGILVCARTFDLARSRHLERVHRDLADEVARLGKRARRLSDSVAGLSRRDDVLRLVAGLDPLSPDVKRGGIGGPSMPWPERDSLLEDGGALGRVAFGLQVDLDASLRQASILASSSREAARRLATRLQELAAAPTFLPTTGFISSPFAPLRLHPLLHREMPHEGLDVGAPEGARILAPAAGRVVTVERDPWNGLMVVLDHGYGITTRYMHLSRAVATVGARVGRGDLLGYVGATGLATGPHLHYEVRLNGRPVDPLAYVLPADFTD